MRASPPCPSTIVLRTVSLRPQFACAGLRGSIVGGRQDLAEAIAFAAEGKVRSHIHKMKLEDINEVFANMKAGKIDGRMVMTF